LPLRKTQNLSTDPSTRWWPKGPLSGGQVPRAAARQGEPAARALAQLVKGEQVDPGGRQLNGQRP